MLVKTGGKNLLMLINSTGDSCLYTAAEGGHADVAEVRQGICRQIDRKEALRRQTRHKRQDPTVVTHLSVSYVLNSREYTRTACYWL